MLSVYVTKQLARVRIRHLLGGGKECEGRHSELYILHGVCDPSGLRRAFRRITIRRKRYRCLTFTRDGYVCLEGGGAFI